jgi:eukaryotic-like serine/threonine-protein kinase
VSKPFPADRASPGRSHIPRTGDGRTVSRAVPAGIRASVASEDDPTVVRRDDETTVVGDAEGRTHELRHRRVEERPRRSRFRDPWPWLLLLLVLVLGGLAAAWALTREDSAEVPAVEGLRLDEAVQRLEDEGFRSDIDQRESDAPEGTVFEQDPAAGEEADEGATVQIVVSRGPATVAVPDVVGNREDAAEEALEDAGFDVRTVEVFSDEPEGVVVAQSPSAGDEAERGSPVRINVSKGRGEVTVPNLIGDARDDAQAELRQLDLQSNVAVVPSAEPEGTVVAQNPAAGETVRVDSTVRLNISSGTGTGTTTDTTAETETTGTETTETAP